MTIKNKYDFVMIFDVENGNPNGDPDFGNAPRTDIETGHGIVTDVCLKRKIRNYVELIKEDEPGYGIIIKEGKALNTKFTEAYEALGLKTKQKGKVEADVIAARDYICKNYFDVRAFGAVMSTGDDPCGIVRGPVQISFAKSVSPIDVQEITITRRGRTTEDRKESGDTEMGRKHIVPYALYRAEGHISAALADKITGLSEEDVELLWDAIINMFEEDHSAARGKMCMRKLIIFKHDGMYGNCPSHKLFDKITITQKEDRPPRAYSDYEVTIDTEMPNGVEIIEKL